MGFFDEKPGEKVEVTPSPSPTAITSVATVEPKINIRISLSDIGLWLKPENTPSTPNICCMIFGLDGVGKSGVVLEYLTPEDIKAGYKMIVLDLDSGSQTLLFQYHKEKMKNIIIRNPLEFTYDENGYIVTDYKRTMNKIKATIKWISENAEKEKIKVVVMDGLSSLLQLCEYQMRVEKEIAPDGGVQTRYWLLRMRFFLDIMEQFRALPLDKFFIGHDDFIQKNDKELSSVKIKTHQMAHQRLILSRIEQVDKVVFRAKIDKSKCNVQLEGKEIDFCTVDKKTGKAVWEGRKAIELFM